MADYLEFTLDKFTFKVAPDRLYSLKGIWAKEENNSIRIGLSDFLQQRSGDVAFAEVKEVGTQLKINSEVAEIETIKVNLTLASPISGKIVHNNPLMESAPETINLDPYGEGWVCDIEASQWEIERHNLLDAKAYFSHMKQEAQNEVK
jgi:glycine cleavage system H protein